MHQLTALALLMMGLGACVGGAADDATTGALAFRQPSAPIYSAAVVDPARLTGNWAEVGALQPASGSACRKGGGMRIDGGQVDYRLCVGGRVAKGRGALRVIGPGRFVLPGLKSPVWVLWVDGDYRSLVLGTPKGGFGIVLDRGSMSGDREAAAREIFDWNGYDLRRYTRF